MSIHGEGHSETSRTCCAVCSKFNVVFCQLGFHFSLIIVTAKAHQLHACRQREDVISTMANLIDLKTSFKLFNAFKQTNSKFWFNKIDQGWGIIRKNYSSHIVNFWWDTVLAMRDVVWVWINGIAKLIDRGLQFKLKIVLGTIATRYLVFYVLLPRCSRKGCRVRFYPWVRDPVLLSSRDNFLVTMPSISSETCVGHSYVILRMDVFPDWPLLVCSFCVSLETSANFCLFVKVIIFFRRKMLKSSDEW